MGAQDAYRGAQKQRVACALTFLMRYHKERDGMLNHIVTGDETWVSYITPESKQQSLHWKHTGLQKGKSSNRHFQQGRSCAPYSGTDKVSSW